MNIVFDNLGAIGIIKDVAPEQLPPEAWTDSLNVRINDNRAEKFSGQDQVYNVTVSAATATQNLASAPWWVLPVIADGQGYWLYATDNHVYLANSTANQLLLTRTAAGADVAYSATANLRWNGGVLAGVALLNNGKDSPQVWLSATSTTRLANMQWDQSAGTTWATRTAGAVTCKVMRTYREYAVALNTIENNVSYPRRVRWSHQVSTNSQPETWDEARTDKEAGYYDMDDTTDAVVDCLPMRDSNIIYKGNSTYLMQWVGGQYVHAFRQLFGSAGLLATNCAVDFFGRHLAVTQGDVVVHDGQSISSIIKSKMRDWLFANIDTTYYANTFVTVSYPHNEVWICFPETGTSTANWCTKALIWNWKDNVFSVRDLPQASFISPGIIETTSSVLTWATVTGTWASTTLTWSSQNYNPADAGLLMAVPSSTTPKLVRLNSTNQFDGTNMTAYLERSGLPIIGVNRQGQPVSDPTRFKRVKSITPIFNAVDGTAITIYIGKQNHTSESVTWSGPYTYTVGTTRTIYCDVIGRYIAVKFETTNNSAWSLLRYTLDIDPAGLQ